MLGVYKTLLLSILANSLYMPVLSFCLAFENWYSERYVSTVSVTHPQPSIHATTYTCMSAVCDTCVQHTNDVKECQPLLGSQHLVLAAPRGPNTADKAPPPPTFA